MSLSVHLDNIVDGETVYQRCVLLRGRLEPSGTVKEEEDVENNLITVRTCDAVGACSFPLQTWPVAQGAFKALVMLSPGINVLTLHHGSEAKEEEEEQRSLRLTVKYIPLLQLPPLYLVIMVAKDSPLLIDCPPAKNGAISSAHSTLEAAISKFRMTAYMWQALTADDMYSKGLGRRSFRLDEVWTRDSVSRSFVNDVYKNTPSKDATRATAMIHVIRSTKTVAELRDFQLAQQNPRGTRREALHKHFSDALKAYGDRFASSCCPVVAGLILDSHFDLEEKLILGHAALGSSDTKGLSLGIFGSHLTYSWPRFMEEVASCLLDVRNPGDTVGNDNDECDTLWQACSIGQGAFLHEVGHAFGAGHTTGIMSRGYARHWPKKFLPLALLNSMAVSHDATAREGQSKEDASWDLREALSFMHLWHFRLPEDTLFDEVALNATPVIDVEESGDGELMIVIRLAMGVVRVEFDNIPENEPSVLVPKQLLECHVNRLRSRFDTTQPLSLKVLGRNGKQRILQDVWKFCSKRKFVRVPGTSIVLKKRSASTPRADSGESTYWHWTVLLHHRIPSGECEFAIETLQEYLLTDVIYKVVEAQKIDLRVGIYLDGAVIYYQNGDHTPCGPRIGRHGRPHRFGGHASQELHIPPGTEITKVQICRGNDELNGIRIHLSNGNAAGELNFSAAREIIDLEPGPGEKIIGFYGQCQNSAFLEASEFGIVVAPRDTDLPMHVYEMVELQNTDGKLPTLETTSPVTDVSSVMRYDGLEKAVTTAESPFFRTFVVSPSSAIEIYALDFGSSGTRQRVIEGCRSGLWRTFVDWQDGLADTTCVAAVHVADAEPEQLNRAMVGEIDASFLGLTGGTERPPIPSYHTMSWDETGEMLGGEFGVCITSSYTTSRSFFDYFRNAAGKGQSFQEWNDAFHSSFNVEDIMDADHSQWTSDAVKIGGVMGFGESLGWNLRLAKDEAGRNIGVMLGGMEEDEE